MRLKSAQYVLWAVFCSALCGCASPLKSAVKRGNIAAVGALLDRGEAINKPIDSFGTKALMEAVREKNLEMVKFLIARGADPNSANNEGFTALMLAATVGDVEIAKALVAAGADPNATTNSGETTALLRANIGGAAMRKYLEPLTTVGREPAATPQSASVPATVQAAPALSPVYKSAEYSEDYAVVIGVENYADLPPATFAERDAAAVRRFVAALGVPERNIISLTGNRATKTGLEKTIETWLPNNVSENSRVFVFYSGHGAPDPKSGDAYLVPVDGDPQYLSQTGYPLKRLYAKLGELKAKKVVVALDSCFSGAGGRSVLAKGTRPLVGKVDLSVGAASKRIEVLSASGADQISGANDEAGYGLFTYNLLQGLNGGAKDASGKITVRSLYDYVRPRVADQARRANRDQTPQLQAEGEGAVLREK